MKRHTIPLLLLTTVCGCPDDGEPVIDVTATATDTDGFDPTDGANLPPFSGDPMTFYIEESVNFSNPNAPASCLNSNVNQVGDWAEAALEDHGFVGTYTLDGAGSPINFIDPTTVGFGNDGNAADSARVTIYAGHGNSGSLQWGSIGAVPPGTVTSCSLPIANQMRLGTATGDVSGFAIYATSCTANTLNNNLRNTLGQSQIGQHVGWHNSPAISDFLLGSFINQTATSIVDGSVSLPVTNRTAWMSIGQSRPGVGKNSPVIYTTGASEIETAERHFTARLALGIGISDNIPEPQDQNVDNVSWVDNGCSSSCIFC